MEDIENIFSLKTCTQNIYLIDVKGIFYSEMCMDMFTLLVFHILMH